MDGVSGQRGLHILPERHVELSLLIRQAMPGQDNDGVVAAIVEAEASILEKGCPEEEE